MPWHLTKKLSKNFMAAKCYSFFVKIYSPKIIMESSRHRRGIVSATEGQRPEETAQGRFLPGSTPRKRENQEAKAPTSDAASQGTEKGE
jgi:hypothetical protein